jgi:hypothetical protein
VPFVAREYLGHSLAEMPLSIIQGLYPLISFSLVDFLRPFEASRFGPCFSIDD